jgi:type II secretion system protein G
MRAKPLFLFTTCIVVTAAWGQGSHQSTNAKIARAKSDLATLQSCVNVLRLDCDRYPTTAEGLSVLRVQARGMHTWRGPYVTQIPKDPWGHPYHYQFVADKKRTGFVLKSDGTKESGPIIAKSWGR